MKPNRSKLMYFLAVILLCAGWAVPSIASGQTFKDANRLYKDSKYDQAIEAYEKISRTGFESGALYYNLGNSYFKKGELGRALLNYERSRLFIPGDSDVRSNYNFVRSLLNVPSGPQGAPWFLKWADLLFDGTGMNGLTVIVSVLWIAMLALSAARLWLPALKPYAVPLAGLCAAALVVSSVALARKTAFYEHGAVVLGSELEAKFEPGAGATTYFKLAEGSPVFILDRTAGWVKIRRPDAKIGWVPADSIAAIKEVPGPGPQ
jgi:tetratricopeptide (TPR) repeat protein